jgi:hypothetical protein
MHVEHEYFRCGAWAYIAALDVHHAKNGIAPFDRLVEQVMTRPRTTTPAASSGSSTTVPPIVDPAPCNACRIAIRNWCSSTLASWLNQVEIYFSIVQRRVLTTE